MIEAALISVTVSLAVGFAFGWMIQKARIIKNLRERQLDMATCHKKDNCKEIAYYIGMYLDEIEKGE